MRDIRFKDAVPPMPDRYYQKMTDTLKEIETMPMRKRVKLSTVLIAAVIAALVLASVALAVAKSDLLDRLFLGSTPPASTQEMLVKNAAVDEKDGLRLTLDEYLFDGASLHVGWTVQSLTDQTVFLLSRYEFEDGGAAENAEGVGVGGYASSDIGDNSLFMLNGKAGGIETGKAHSAYAGFVYGADKPTRPIEFTVTVDAYTTDLTPVSAEETCGVDFYLDIDEEISDTLSRNGQIAVTSEGFTVVDKYPEFREALSRILEGASEGEDVFDAANIAAHAESGLLKPYTTLSVTVRIDPTEAEGTHGTHISGTSTFDTKMGTVIIREMNFSAASTYIEYDVYPKEPLTDTGNWFDGYRLLVADKDKNALTVPLGIGADADQRTAEDGRKYIHVTMSGNPASEIPETVLLAFIPAVRDESVPYIPAVYYQGLIDNAGPDDIITVQLAQ